MTPDVLEVDGTASREKMEPSGAGPEKGRTEVGNEDGGATARVRMSAGGQRPGTAVQGAATVGGITQAELVVGTGKVTPDVLEVDGTAEQEKAEPSRAEPGKGRT